MFGRKRKEAQNETPDELYARARALQHFNDRPEKIQLLAAAADAGHKVAAFDLGVILEKDHQPDDARERYRQAVDLGHAVAPKFLAALDEQQKVRSAEAERLAAIRADAEAGDVEAMRRYGWELDADHTTAESGFGWYEKAAAAGDRLAIQHVARLLPYRDKENGLTRAEQMLRDDAADGDREALSALADFLVEHNPEVAIDALTGLDAAGDVTAAERLARLHWRAARLADAERWYRRALTRHDGEEADDLAAALGCVLLEAGRAEEAEPLLRRSIDGDLHLAWLLEARGDDDEALELYGHLVEQDDDQIEAKAGLARIHRRRGDVDDAEMWTEQALEGGADMQLPEFVRRSS